MVEMLRAKKKNRQESSDPANSDLGPLADSKSEQRLVKACSGRGVVVRWGWWWEGDDNRLELFWVFRELHQGRGIRQSPLWEDDMLLRLPGGSINVGPWWHFNLLYLLYMDLFKKEPEAAKNLSWLHRYPFTSDLSYPSIYSTHSFILRP